MKKFHLFIYLVQFLRKMDLQEKMQIN